MNLTLRTYEEAVTLCTAILRPDTHSTTEYSTTASALGPLASGPYLRFFSDRLVGEIASDFCVPSLRALRLENEQRDCPSCQLGRQWWLFATPTEMYDEAGALAWQAQLDVYGLATTSHRRERPGGRANAARAGWLAADLG